MARRPKRPKPKTSARPEAEGQSERRSYTRDWGLLVPDQMILDLIYRTPLDRLPTLAARFLAIQDAIREGEFRVVSAISRESSARLFREIVAAIEQGLDRSDTWSANNTASAIVCEAFRFSPSYLSALDRFRISLRAIRAGANETTGNLTG